MITEIFYLDGEIKCNIYKRSPENSSRFITCVYKIVLWYIVATRCYKSLDIIKRGESSFRGDIAEKILMNVFFRAHIDYLVVRTTIVATPSSMRFASQHILFLLSPLLRIPRMVSKVYSYMYTCAHSTIVQFHQPTLMHNTKLTFSG